jgi:tryprostatin B 6-hydroxylase
MIYYLIRKSHHTALIRQELSSVNIRNYKDLQYLQYLQHLNACIYETLRLNPAIPSAGLRLAPKGGITVKGKLIPEGTTSVTPQYSLHRGNQPVNKKHERQTMLTGL